eukprot:scaffold55054_cov61-Phaeocystis_antarctica.AAC.3
MCKAKRHFLVLGPEQIARLYPDMRTTFSCVLPQRTVRAPQLPTGSTEQFVIPPELNGNQKVAEIPSRWRQCINVNTELAERARRRRGELSEGRQESQASSLSSPRLVVRHGCTARVRTKAGARACNGRPVLCEHTSQAYNQLEIVG